MQQLSLSLQHANLYKKINHMTWQRHHDDKATTMTELPQWQSHHNDKATNNDKSTNTKPWQNQHDDKKWKSHLKSLKFYLCILLAIINIFLLKEISIFQFFFTIKKHWKKSKTKRLINEKIIHICYRYHYFT